MRHVAAALEEGTDVLGAADCEAGLVIADAHPDLELVLLDFNLRGLAGVPAIRRWRDRFPALPVVVLSSADDRATVLAALNAGAAGFVPTSSSNEVMLSALRLVLAGGKYLPSELLGHADAPAPSRAATAPSIDTLGLSPRQFDVLRLVAEGKANKVICDELGLAERTVKTHVTQVMRALGVSNRTQAALAAARLGLRPRDAGGSGT